MQDAEGEVVAVDLTQDDRERMRVFLKVLYPSNPSIIDSWEMNEAVFFIIQDIFQRGIFCSEAIDLVPRPEDLIGVKGIRTAKEVLRSIAVRIAKERARNKLGGETRIKFICQNSLGWAYRRRLDVAGSGL